MTIPALTLHHPQHLPTLFPRARKRIPPASLLLMCSFSNSERANPRAGPAFCGLESDPVIQNDIKQLPLRLAEIQDSVSFPMFLHQGDADKP
jgi:hypothetical protein